MRQGAQGWCTGMTLRDGMGREVGVLQTSYVEGTFPMIQWLKLSTPSEGGWALVPGQGPIYIYVYKYIYLPKQSNQKMGGRPK